MFTDIHFGEHGDDDVHNNYCLEFIGWFIEQAKERGCDCIAFLGDWHHSQVKIGSKTLNYSYDGLAQLNQCGLPVIFLIGNHDILYKDNRSVHSIPFAHTFSNITVVNQIERVGDSVFVPWVTPGDDLAPAHAPDVKYVFGHFEFPGFWMNEAYIMPDNPKAIHAEDFGTPEYVLSGHYHKRQMQRIKNTSVVYIGNPFPHDYSDAGDRERGMAILDLSEYCSRPLSFIDWPGMPTYDRVTLTHIMENPEKFSSRATIKIIPEGEMSIDERDEIRKVLTESMGIQNVAFEPVETKEYLELAEAEEGKEMSMDERVISFLQIQDWKGVSSTSERMIELYIKADIIS